MNTDPAERARMYQRMQDAKKERFALMDEDSDVAVSKDTFMASGQKRFEASDQDGDGTVTVWEYRAMRRAGR